MAASKAGDILTKVSTESATSFAEDYYRALESSRSTITSFYAPPSAMQSGKPLPTILFNGSAVPDGGAVQEIFEMQMPPAHYEMQSIDCQVLNPDYVPSEDMPASKAATSSISILVLVSGSVRFGESRSEPQRGFSETFVLVPNNDTSSQRGVRGQRRRDFLIQSQNFRLVV